MAPMWKNYLTDISKIMYVVDTANLCQISAAGTFSVYLELNLGFIIIDRSKRRFAILTVGRTKIADS